VAKERLFSRLVLEDAGPSIRDFTSGLQLLQAFRTAIESTLSSSSLFSALITHSRPLLPCQGWILASRHLANEHLVRKARWRSLWDPERLSGCNALRTGQDTIGQGQICRMSNVFHANLVFLTFSLKGSACLSLREQPGGRGGPRISSTQAAQLSRRFGVILLDVRMDDYVARWPRSPRCGC